MCTCFGRPGRGRGGNDAGQETQGRGGHRRAIDPHPLRRGRRGVDIDVTLKETIMALAVEGVECVEDREERQKMHDER